MAQDGRHRVPYIDDLQTSQLSRIDNEQRKHKSKVALRCNPIKSCSSIGSHRVPGKRPLHSMRGPILGIATDTVRRDRDVV